MSKKVWLICKYASPEKYFMGTRHFHFAEEWNKNGHDVTIFTSNSSHLTEKLPNFSGSFMLENNNGVRTVWLKVIKSKKSTSIYRILSWIHFEFRVLLISKKKFPKPDVIIVSSLSILSIISGYILSRHYKSRFILEIRDIWPLSAMQLGGYSKNHPFIWFLAKLEKFGYRNADVIVGTMPNLIEHVREVEPRFKECVCIPQGISQNQLEISEGLNDDFIKDTFTQDTFKVVYAGTINPNNPIEVLLKAVSQMPKELKIEAYILGSGSMLDGYKQIYSSFSNIKFIPSIPKKQVNAFLQKMDLCFDSIDSELARFGLSRNKWIDYLNSGKPIVCSYSGFPSMINEAYCGSFVPFGDVGKLYSEIVYYKNMPLDERLNMGLRAREYLRKNRLFSLLAKDYEELFY